MIKRRGLNSRSELEESGVIEAIFFVVLGVVITTAAFLGGVAAGKISAYKENGKDPNKARVSPRDLISSTRRSHSAKA